MKKIVLGVVLVAIVLFGVALAVAGIIWLVNRPPDRTTVNDFDSRYFDGFGQGEEAVGTLRSKRIADVTAQLVEKGLLLDDSETSGKVSTRATTTQSKTAVPADLQGATSEADGTGSPKPDLIYVISLHGTIGHIPWANAKAFTPEALQGSLAAAKRANATIVVLDLNGPGGSIADMRAMVKVLLDAQLSGIRIIALPRDALSAWASVALACKEIVVTPTSRMGAAVAVAIDKTGVVESPEALDAVSQKLAAPWHALCRQIDDFTGRPRCIVNAMRIQANELWWSPTSGFSDKCESGDDWEQLDDESSVCCLTSAEMRRTGIAIGEICELSELVNLLHCAPATKLITSYPVPPEARDLHSVLHELRAEAVQFLKPGLAERWSICNGEWINELDWREFRERLDVGEVHFLTKDLPGVWSTEWKEVSIVFQYAEVWCDLWIKELSPVDKLNGFECLAEVSFLAAASRMIRRETGPSRNDIQSGVVRRRGDPVPYHRDSWLEQEGLKFYCAGVRSRGGDWSPWEAVPRPFIHLKIYKHNGVWDLAEDLLVAERRAIYRGCLAPVCDTIPR